MTKRYVDEDGMYLVPDTYRGEVCAAWFDSENDEIAAPVGEGDTKPKDHSGILTKNEWESWVAYWAMAPFCSDRIEGSVLTFSSEKKARAAIKATNEALLRGDSKPWPEWAMQAKANGWTAPEGWKP